jgi:hypothetical protein
MEPPLKRVKIADPDIRNPRDSGSRRTEGLYTSELGMRSDETDHQPRPTRTISLSDLQRQRVFDNYQHPPKHGVTRRSAGIYLLPRAPDATVTATVVQVNVNDGTTISKATEVPIATTGAIVSLTDVGLLTSALSLSIPGASNGTITGGPTDSVPPTITSSTTPTGDTSGAGSTSRLTTSRIFTTSRPPNGTITTSSSEGRTVTVTATSTFEVSLINGTAFVTEAPTAPVTDSDSVTTNTVSQTYTFGDLGSTYTSGTGTSSASGTGAQSGGYPAGVAATVTDSPTSTTDAAATSSSNSGGGGGGGSTLTPVQQQVVGGVVGGVAGVALVLVIVLFVLRWYRRRLKARGELPEQIAAREIADVIGGGEAYPMSQRSSMTPFAAAVTQGLRKFRPHSAQTFGTTATGLTDTSIPESERGFQKIAGRKLAPVLNSGGDQYGGNFGAFEKDGGGPSGAPDLPSERGLSGASFYQDNKGFYGGRGILTPTDIPSSPTVTTTGNRTTDVSGGTASSARDFAAMRGGSIHNSSQASIATVSRPEGFAVMRASPARTPVTSSPAASSIRLPIQQPPSMAAGTPPMPVMPVHDAVGRTLASHDGSHISRSSGRSVGRFVENV